MYVSIYEQALNNKLLVVEINDVKLVFSYDALIGVIYKNVFFVETYYKNYSVTTNKHISYIKNEYFVNIVFVETSLLEYIIHKNDFETLYNAYKKYNEFVEDFNEKINQMLYYSIDAYEFLQNVYNLKHFKEFQFDIDVEQVILSNKIKETIKLNSMVFNSFDLKINQYKTLKKETNKDFNVKINFDKIKKEFILQDLI